MAGLRVVAIGIGGILEQLADDDGAIGAGIVDDLLGRRLNRLADDVDTGFLIGICRDHRCRAP